MSLRALDVEYVRSRFPAFAEPTLRDFAHFENAGGSYACAPVVERLNRFYRQTKVQPYYRFAPSARAGELMDVSRRRLADWLNVQPEELHFGPSTSQNTYVVAQALRQHLQPGDEIIVTNQDHEANVGAWRRLEADGIVIREWQVDPESGDLDVAGLDALLGERTRVACFTHCSNVVGTINPVRNWVDRIHAAGAIAIVDGVSFAPHGMPDVRLLGADIYLFSLYKVYGPHLGVMTMKSSLNAALPNQGHFFNSDKPNARFTPAGPDHAQIGCVTGLIEYLEGFFMHHCTFPADFAGQSEAVRTLFRGHEIDLLQPLLDFLSGHRKVRLIGRRKATERAPTVAFTVRGKRSQDLAEKLAKLGIGVGVGDFYARRVVEALGIDPADGVLRASFVHYTHPDEVERLIKALDKLM